MMRAEGGRGAEGKGGWREEEEKTTRMGRYG